MLPRALGLLERRRLSWGRSREKLMERWSLPRFGGWVMRGLGWRLRPHENPLSLGLTVPAPMRMGLPVILGRCVAQVY